MQPIILQLPSGDINVRKFGSGPRLLIAFHGFAEDGSAFTGLGRALGDTGMLYAIDLPFHGGTFWKGTDYRPGQLAGIVEAILEREGFLRFEAIGHSLGARLWLHLLPAFQGRLERAYLLAPDGLQSRWLHLVEWLPAGWRRRFAGLLSRPGWLLALASALHRACLIDDFLLRYLRFHLSDESKRHRLLHTWGALSYFRLGGNRARHLIRQGQAPVLVLLGDKDQLVDPEAIRQRLKGLNDVGIEVVNATHRSICQAAVPWIERKAHFGSF